ncbi:hypothetical protein [Vibrio coralliilyticus]|uniref:Uncharacterized protein n=1 Tax=Vibrio coralliilyticus TaxID=190893 RepID=A0AAP7DFS4_9VIBR|nr:hypothetical protein [Vibrio coralliilyticus]NOJ25192.1 hypothetical protein [Vibrio coralliilyticus]
MISLQAIIEAEVNTQVRDWIDKLRLIKYTNYPYTNFLVDVKSTKEVNGDLEELLTLINANCDSTCTFQELVNSQYVFVKQIN